MLMEQCYLFNLKLKLQFRDDGLSAFYSIWNSLQIRMISNNSIPTPNTEEEIQKARQELLKEVFYQILGTRLAQVNFSRPFRPFDYFFQYTYPICLTNPIWRSSVIYRFTKNFQLFSQGNFSYSFLYYITFSHPFFNKISYVPQNF